MSESTAIPAASNVPVAPAPTSRRAHRPFRANPFAPHGEPQVWLAGGALAVCLAMIAGLLSFILARGMATLWPSRLIEATTFDGTTYRKALGEPARQETYRPDDETLAEWTPEAQAIVRQNGGDASRLVLRTGNHEMTGSHFSLIEESWIVERSEPDWAFYVEREESGPFFGFPRKFLIDGEPAANKPEEVWAKFREFHADARRRRAAARDLEERAIGEVNRDLEGHRFALYKIERRHGKDSSQYRQAEEAQKGIQAEAARRIAAIRERTEGLNAENKRYAVVMSVAAVDEETGEGKDGEEVSLELAEITRAYPANRLGWWERLGVYRSRWWEFLTTNPRNSNSEGGVFPAIFGTIVMTLGMSLAVAPFGVLAALYLREYAKPGLVLTLVRIAINNLAGVPSIVFGLFGMVFFCYIVGSRIDDTFELPPPTFGQGALLWASLTLALLTVPAVIVATEEALAAVPGSMREGSYACGASKWQTIRRIVLPRAMPGIMTGMILAMSRGAGEVAPLMLVGAARVADDLPIDGHFPFIHPQRKFMHLGFHIYDAGFQASNSEAARPMVFTTTLLLIAIVTSLNLAAIWIRGRLKKKFESSHF